MANTPPGPGVDASGQAVIDPTSNVKALNEASVIRSDDLRKAERRYFDSQIGHLESIIKLQAKHDRQLRHAEAKRIDAIRAVDVAAVQAAAAEQRDAADRLATQVATSADALRLQVAATATATEQKLLATVGPLQNAIEDLRKAQYQTQGERQQVVETRATSSDQRGDKSVTWQIIGVLIAIAIFVLAYTNSQKDQTPNGAPVPIEKENHYDTANARPNASASGYHYT